MGLLLQIGGRVFLLGSPKKISLSVKTGGEHFDGCCCESVGQGVDQNKFQECDAKSGVKQDYDM